MRIHKKYLIVKIFFVLFILVFDIVATLWLIKIFPYISYFSKQKNKQVFEMDRRFARYLTANNPHAAIKDLHEILDVLNKNGDSTHMRKFIIARLYLLYSFLGDKVQAQFWLKELNMDEQEADTLIQFIARMDYRSGIIWGLAVLAQQSDSTSIDIKYLPAGICENE